MSPTQTDQLIPGGEILAYKFLTGLFSSKETFVEKSHKNELGFFGIANNLYLIKFSVKSFFTDFIFLSPLI